MPARWVYCPWASFEGDRIEETVARYNRKYDDGHGSGVQVVRHGSCATSKPLQDIRESDMLLILGHGLPRRVEGEANPDNKTERTIGYRKPAQYSFFGSETSPAVQHRISCNDLAAQLQTDGLPEKHNFVKCLNCFGGGLGIWAAAEGGGGKVIHDPLAHASYGEHFACQLAKALFGLGYERILVGGYPGAIDSHLDAKTITLLFDRDEDRTKHEAGFLNTQYREGGQYKSEAKDVGLQGIIDPRIATEFMVVKTKDADCCLWWDGRGHLQSATDVKKAKWHLRGWDTLGPLEDFKRRKKNW
jgi:hypothetical protein